MDNIDKQLLALLRHGIPLEKRPFEGLARQLHLDHAEFFIRIGRLKRAGVLGEIRGIFDMKRMGWRKSLAAMRVPEPEVSRAMDCLHGHPGIQSIVLRDHDLNLWFSFAAPSAGILEKHLERLRCWVGVPSVYRMSAVEIFKKSFETAAVIRENGSGHPQSHDGRDESAGNDADLTPEELALVARLQESFPVADDPFAMIAGDLGLEEKALYAALKGLMDKGCLRAIRLFEPPTLCGEAPDLLTVWQLPDEKIRIAGEKAARMESVRHCASRVAHADFPYNLYVTVAGQEEEAVSEMEKNIGAWPRVSLKAVRAVQKNNPRYSPEDFREWWNRTGDEIVRSTRAEEWV
jgi:DNA-binding Lrp family transcriptional regulator